MIMLLEVQIRLTARKLVGANVGEIMNVRKATAQAFEQASAIISRRFIVSGLRSFGRERRERVIEFAHDHAATFDVFASLLGVGAALVGGVALQLRLVLA